MELCTTLMERWRLETNTFHMYHGEMTITLEDVSFITSLPVDGAVVFEEYPDKDYDWGLTIFRILGETPGEDDYSKDGRLKLTWLRSTFKDPNKISSSDELQLKQYASEYALACIRSFLMAERSGVAVHPVYLLLERERPSDEQHFAWRTAALAWLYIEMGRSVFNLETHGKAGGNIWGWMVLLQACALERFPSIAQRTYDDRRRGPDGQDHPSLRRCSLEPNRNLF
ncbi:Serine/threonine-protein phosphatase 7 long form homolog [Linum grandiflorum]